MQRREIHGAAGKERDESASGNRSSPFLSHMKPHAPE
jgi:hypothetical protein